MSSCLVLPSGNEPLGKDTENLMNLRKAVSFPFGGALRKKETDRKTFKEMMLSWRVASIEDNNRNLEMEYFSASCLPLELISLLCWPQPGLWWRNLIDWIRGTNASERKCDSQLHNWELLTWRLRAMGVQCFAGYHPWGHRVGHDWATESTLSSSPSLCVRVWGRRIQNTTKNICQAEREKGGWGVEGEACESR